MESVQKHRSKAPVGGSRRGQLGPYGVAILILVLLFIFVFFLPQFFKMRTGIYSLSCKEIRRKIETAVVNYHAQNTLPIGQPGKPINLDTLKAQGFLMEIQKCPEGGKYVLGTQSEVICTCPGHSAGHAGSDRAKPH